jgi:hypothetical protein
LILFGYLFYFLQYFLSDHWSLSPICS